MAVLNRILRVSQSGDEALGSLRGPSFATRRYHGRMQGEEQSEVWFEAVSTGNVPATPAALGAVPPVEILFALKRHLSGDWGELDRHDWNANNEALIDASRLLSAYTTSTGQRF